MSLRGQLCLSILCDGEVMISRKWKQPASLLFLSIWVTFWKWNMEAKPNPRSHSDQNLQTGISQGTLNSQLSPATAEWEAQTKTGSNLLPTNMLCSWLTCPLIRGKKKASVQAAVSFTTLNPFMAVNTNVFVTQNPIQDLCLKTLACSVGLPAFPTMPFL